MTEDQIWEGTFQATQDRLVRQFDQIVYEVERQMIATGRVVPMALGYSMRVPRLVRSAVAMIRDTRKRKPCVDCGVWRGIAESTLAEFEDCVLEVGEARHVDAFHRCRLDIRDMTKAVSR